MKKTSKTKKAFVLMPFKEPYNSYYTAIFKPALEDAAFSVTRADDLFAPRPIMLDIQQSIYEADIILCEMSERNPNVFYELGLAHAIGKPAILIARKEDDIPFDLRHIRTVIYDVSLLDWKKKLKKGIVLAAKSIKDPNDVWPPPLTPSSNLEDKSLQNLLRDIQEKLSREQDFLNSKITVVLAYGTQKHVLPLELTRSDLSRAEILGRIAMLPMSRTQSGRRFSISYFNTRSFLQNINDIKSARSGDATLIIPCTEEEFKQFDLD
jgi:hypothetical protein